MSLRRTTFGVLLIEKPNRGDTVSQSHLENLKPFKPGQSGNPKGRPKGARSMTSYLKDLLKQEATGTKSKSVAEDLMSRLVATALTDPKVGARLKALDMVLDRTEGKAIQPVIQKELPTTNASALEDLKEVAKQEGISFEDFCDREGIIDI